MLADPFELQLAATRVQSSFRGFKARREVNKMREEQQKEMNEAATKLQATLMYKSVDIVGPFSRNKDYTLPQIDELTKAVEALKEANIMQRTKVEHQLAEAKERKAKTDAKLAEALARIHAVMLASAEAMLGQS